MALKYRLLLNDWRISLGSLLLVLGTIFGFYFSANYISIENYDRPTPLHSNVYFGIDSVGAWTSLYWYVLIIAILMIVHVVGSLYLFDHSRRRSLSWLYFGVLVQALVLYSFWHVLNLA